MKPLTVLVSRALISESPTDFVKSVPGMVVAGLPLRSNLVFLAWATCIHLFEKEIVVLAQFNFPKDSH